MLTMSKTVERDERNEEMEYGLEREMGICPFVENCHDSEFLEIYQKRCSNAKAFGLCNRYKRYYKQEFNN